MQLFVSYAAYRSFNSDCCSVQALGGGGFAPLNANTVQKMIDQPKEQEHEKVSTLAVHSDGLDKWFGVWADRSTIFWLSQNMRH
jgi:hypothetical protein